MSIDVYIHLFYSLLLFTGSVRCSVRPQSAICGILQTPPVKGDDKHQFAGVYIPGSGIRWYARRRKFLIDDTLEMVLKLADFVRYKRQGAYRNDCPKDFLYRIFIVNKLVSCAWTKDLYRRGVHHRTPRSLNALRYAIKSRMVSARMSGDELLVYRNGLLDRVLRNYY